MIRRRIGTLILATGLLFAGCSSLPPQDADALAGAAGLQKERSKGGRFLITAYIRMTRTDAPLTVYIEGDGFAWRTRTQPSDNPTPRQAIGLALAATDRSPNVVYLARPCQFTPLVDDPACGVDYWTGKRFAPEVIESLDEVLSGFMSRLPGQKVNLVGFSGGAAVAALIAARRNDVMSLRSVAGNLDHAAVNRLHKVSPMPNSLNAIDIAPRLAHIPQLHFSGSEDSIIPPDIAVSFIAATGRCARALSVPGMTHNGAWAGLWPDLLAVPLPACD